jgi:acyl-coenzyme A thioesterase PaaI-like protein
MKGRRLRRLINLWPPFLFTGIRATRIRDDFHEVDVALRLRWYNRNYVGTHFGGSLFAMTDPWYMLMLVQILGRDYFVWDRHSCIDFVAPGRGVVSARFRLDEEVLRTIRERTAGGEKYLPEFTVDIIGEQGELVAQVVKTLYVRRKPAAR